MSSFDRPLISASLAPFPSQEEEEQAGIFGEFGAKSKGVLDGEAHESLFFDALALSEFVVPPTGQTTSADFILVTNINGTEGVLVQVKGTSK